MVSNLKTININWNGYIKFMYNVLFVDMAIFTTLSLVAGVFLDISYQFIDPRIRMGAKR